MKQCCCQRCYKWGYQKHHTKKKTYKLQVRLQEFDFKNAKDNLIGSKLL